MTETPLYGGRVTEGVVRLGDTVRRPRRPNSDFVRALLDHLASVGFRGAPRFLGSDESGRDALSFLPGDVPSDLSPGYPDETLAAAARLIRRFHDATAGTGLAADSEVVCHNDLSPCNFVFRGADPVGLIDYDAAAPGSRLRDVAYALFLWLNLGADGPDVREQARRARVFLDAYGAQDREDVVEAVLDVQREGLGRVEPAAVEWWAAQIEWTEAHRRELERGLR